MSDPKAVELYHNFLRNTVTKLQNSIKQFRELEEHFFRLELNVPEWEESMDSRTLFTFLSVSGRELEKVNRAFAVFYYLRSEYHINRQSNIRLTFNDRVTLEEKIRLHISVLEDKEAALKLHKEDLLHKIKLAHQTSYLIGREEARHFGKG